MVRNDKRSPADEGLQQLQVINSNTVSITSLEITEPPPTIPRPSPLHSSHSDVENDAIGLSTLRSEAVLRDGLNVTIVDLNAPTSWIAAVQS